MPEFYDILWCNRINQNSSWSCLSGDMMLFSIQSEKKNILLHLIIKHIAKGGENLGFSFPSGILIRVPKYSKNIQILEALRKVLLVI